MFVCFKYISIDAFHLNFFFLQTSDFFSQTRIIFIVLVALLDMGSLARWGTGPKRVLPFWGPFLCSFICRVPTQGVSYAIYIYIYHESELLSAQLKFSFTNSLSFDSISVRVGENEALVPYY